MSIVMSINLKGGVAKTTTAVAVAEYLASEKYRTLLIDADHQCMAGELLLGEGRQLKTELSKRNLFCLFMDMMFNESDLTPEEFETRVTRKASNIGGGLERLAVLPCSMRMDEVYEKLRERMKTSPELSWKDLVKRLSKRRVLFSKWLRQEFDFVIIDCPPSFGFQVKFFLSVADSFVVPCVPDRLSVRGSLYLLDRIKTKGYKIVGIGTLWSLYRESNPLHRDRVETAKNGSDAELEMLPLPFDTIVPIANEIASATEFYGSKPKTFVQKYTPEYARLFARLSREIVQRAEGLTEESAAEEEMEALAV